MTQRGDQRPVRYGAATPFPASGADSRIARLIVLDMVLWPGVLFIGVSLFAAWQVRDHLVALVAVLVATLFSVAVGVRQWDVMLRAVAPPARVTPATHDSSLQEASPRLTGRGTTED
jgi:hypothetical protein